MRKYVGMTLTYRIEVEEIEAVQDPGPDFIDTPEIAFKWQIGWCGLPHTVTPTRISEGHYEVSITPTESGTLFWRWDTDGETDAVKEGHDIILPSAFETAHQRDCA
jgi:hypothetical protein